MKYRALGNTGLLVGQIGFWYALISFNALTDVPC